MVLWDVILKTCRDGQPRSDIVFGHVLERTENKHEYSIETGELKEVEYIPFDGVEVGFDYLTPIAWLNRLHSVIIVTPAAWACTRMISPIPPSCKSMNTNLNQTLRTHSISSGKWRILEEC